MFVKRPLFLAIVVWMALLVRLLFVSKVHPVPVSDFHWYYTQGMAIANGQGYRYDGQPTAYFPIGYPLFLAGVFKIFGEGWWPAVLANVVLDSATAGLVYLIAEYLWSPVVALISGLAMALYVPHIQWSSVICSEIIFSFLFLLTGYLWLRSERRSWTILVASGITLGMACLVRPITLLFPAAYLIYAWFRKFGFWQSVRRFVVIVVVMLITISPVTIRNYEAFHQVLLVSANGGVNLWQGNNPNANGSYFWPENPKQNPFLDYEAKAVQENPIAKHMAESYILHHPLHTIRMGFVKWRYFFSGVYYAQFYTTRISQPPVTQAFASRIARLSEASYVVTYVLGALGIAFAVVEALRRRSLRSSILWLGILYYLGLFFIFPAWDRMREPMSPWVIVFVGLALWPFNKSRAPSR
ncbi:glycosyltransferase family 39 protein [Alicyclobacillus cycloheptanicus]|uniref:4-amino-4-deoxy-L-arabinose transferase-like glycosyltransferase n=1 Tax=Alicyclobacillus cycloheptanicus TaxID=1457 RepID=A0ABT9XP99_9BACL|nr:glycosyltransferase family 39 protein [Alicyclobacillus cycloheptanicus]MDQ0191583.1 4-amino-4-deoxy-L-arabinose transferase-like glycosyltransferase [Alicyclobacillus cycloheptanicus]WDM02216.1 glycosyltransferase family 39 protein [Alicyclobacillus cycloheptanicus]